MKSSSFPQEATADAHPTPHPVLLLILDSVRILTLSLPHGSWEARRPLDVIWMWGGKQMALL